MATLKIESAADVAVNHWWSADDVRKMCIANDLYTCGDCDEYETMLNTVRSTAGNPTLDVLYTVAKDIAEHSKRQTVGNMLYLLSRYAVVTTYEIPGEEDM